MTVTASSWVTKDSGRREQYDSGMVRDTQDGKPRFDLMLPRGVPYEEQLLTRFARLLERGAQKYGERNWEKATGDEELARARASAFRHFTQWFCGEVDEDHAAAVMFNLMAAEFVRYRMTVEGTKGDNVDRESAFGLPMVVDPGLPSDRAVIVDRKDSNSGYDQDDEDEYEDGIEDNPYYDSWDDYDEDED